MHHTIGRLLFLIECWVAYVHSSFWVTLHSVQRCIARVSEFPIYDVSDYMIISPSVALGRGDIGSACHFAIMIDISIHLSYVCRFR